MHSDIECHSFHLFVELLIAQSCVSGSLWLHCSCFKRDKNEQI